MSAYGWRFWWLLACGWTMAVLVGWVVGVTDVSGALTLLALMFPALTGTGAVLTLVVAGEGWINSRRKKPSGDIESTETDPMRRVKPPPPPPFGEE